MEGLAALAPIDSYLEIGVQEGASLSAVIRANPALRQIILCDTWGCTSGGTGRGSHDHIAQLLADLHYQGECVFLDGPSQTTLRQIQQPVDVAFVDGSHETADALIDLQLVWLVARRIVIHDLYYPTVWAAVAQWLPSIHAQIEALDFLEVAVNGLLVVTRKRGG